MFSINGGCTIANIHGRERKRAKIRLRASGALSHDEGIGEAVEAVSFDDTLREIRRIVEGGLNKDQAILINSIDMYEVIADIERKTRAHRIARVETKYKTVDRKVKPVAAPLPEGSLERIKGVAIDPSLRDPAGIGHRFTNKMVQGLKIGGGGFLLPTEEDQFKRMLERHGKAFTFSPGEIGCVNPTIVEPMVIFTVPHVPWCLKPIQVPRAHMPMLMELLKQKVDMSILEPSSAPYSNRWILRYRRRTIRCGSSRTYNWSTK